MAQHPRVRVSRFMCLIVAAFLMAPAAQAADPVGEAVKLRGEAHITRSGADLAVKPGTGIEVQDKISTGAGARLQIRFLDGSIITLGENSAVTIDRYAVNSGNGLRKVQLSALAGVLNALAAKSAESNFDYRIKTANGYSAVRGTNWIVALQGPATAIYVVGGLVEVGSNTGNRVVVEAGKSVTLDAQGLGQPQPIAPDVLKQLTDATDVASADAAPETPAAPAAVPAPAEPPAATPPPKPAKQKNGGSGGHGGGGGGMH